MKNSILARPNLKAFLVGAILMVLLQHVLTNGLSQGQSSAWLQAAHGREVTEADLERLIVGAREKPSTLAYLRISHVYEKRGDFKQALRYLRRADKLESIQAETD